MKPFSQEDAYRWATGLCARSEQCPSDLIQKMLRRGLSLDEAKSVLEKLKDEGFVDEARYARAFVNDRLRYEGWGKLKLRAALSQKHIEKTYISEALLQIDEESYQHVLRDILRSKLRQIKANSDFERRQKLARFAIGRGFEPHLVFNSLDLEGVGDESYDSDDEE